MLIAWTTMTDRADADKLAQASIDESLAVCVQIEGPLTSVYRWEGRIERSQEYRLMFKVLPEQAARLESLILSLHPYDTPEWLMLPVQHVGEKYLSWARANSTSSPL